MFESQVNNVKNMLRVFVNQMRLLFYKTDYENSL